MGYKARHPTANFFDYFFRIHKKPVCLIHLLLSAHKKIRRQRECTPAHNAPHRFYPFLFISFLCRLFRPTAGIRVEESFHTHDSLHTIAVKDQGFVIRRSYTWSAFRFCPSSLPAPPSTRTSFWVWVFFFFFLFQPTYSFQWMQHPL